MSIQADLSSFHPDVRLYPKGEYGPEASVQGEPYAPVVALSPRCRSEVLIAMEIVRERVAQARARMWQNSPLRAGPMHHPNPLIRIGFMATQVPSPWLYIHLGMMVIYHVAQYGPAERTAEMYQDLIRATDLASEV